MKKFISLFVIATMILAAMSITASANDVTAIDQFVTDGTTVNKLTANIEAPTTLELGEGQSLIVDLNGFTWSCDNIVLKITGGTSVVSVYDSSEAKTGKIDSGNDAIDISNGTLSLKDITVEGGIDACDAVFANGGNITIENCTLSAGKAGIDSSNGSSAAGVSVVVTVKDTTFANYSDPGSRNCAIELRQSSDAQKITLTGNNVFENNSVIIKNNYTKGVENGIVAAEGATVTFSEAAAHPANSEYSLCQITYTAPAAGEGEGEGEGEGDVTDPGENPETGDAFVVVAMAVAAVAFAGVVVCKKVRA